MATGKPIVAAIDGCCPDNKVREQLGFKVTEAYKAKMRHNLEDMLAYGITLTTDYSLCSKVNEVFSAKVSLPALDNSKPAPKKVSKPASQKSGNTEQCKVRQKSNRQSRYSKECEI